MLWCRYRPEGESYPLVLASLTEVLVSLAGVFAGAHGCAHCVRGLS